MSSTDLPSSSFIDYSLQQDPSASAGLGLESSSADFLSPLLWSGNTTGATYASQDPLSFGQAWEASADTLTPAVPPLDLDFTFGELARVYTNTYLRIYMCVCVWTCVLTSDRRPCPDRRPPGAYRHSRFFR